MTERKIEAAYAEAREIYAGRGVETEDALRLLKTVSLSLPCWQGDDIRGFERPAGSLAGGGLAVSGSFPGRARTIEELRADLALAFRLIPGRHRLNLHAIYGEFGGRPVERNAIGFESFRGWAEWARREGLGLDFNATCFGHPLAGSGLTLTHPDAAVRGFWIDHVKCCRRISADLGRALGGACLHNLWVPDGTREVPVDRLAFRGRLKEALDEIFETPYDPAEMIDSLESKLFGLGAEAFTAGSHEFYLAYALGRGKLVCLDLGHFHPTESMADKISALLPFFPGIVFHLSRGLRWDSDHVVVLDDTLRAVTEEVVRCRALGRVRLALDYFDAGLNRVGAWVVGARAALAAILEALLLPESALRKAESEGRGLAGLALREEAKALPFGAVWDRYCATEGAPPGSAWLAEVERYERDVLRART